MFNFKKTKSKIKMINLKYQYFIFEIGKSLFYCNKFTKDYSIIHGNDK
jgi:hypothetical protein